MRCFARVVWFAPALALACSADRPGSSKPAPVDPTVSQETAEVTDAPPVDTGSPRASCLADPIEVTPGAWDDVVDQGQGAFVPFSAGDPLMMWGESGRQSFVANYVVANAHDQILVAHQLVDTATGRQLEYVYGNELYLPLWYPDHACTALPTSARGGYIDEALPDGSSSSMAYCCYDGLPVTLSWTVTDLADGRTASGSIPLVATLYAPFAASCDPWVESVCP